MTDFILTNAADLFPQGQDNSGDDQIFGLAGADQIQGGSGSDLIDGGTDSDSLFGGGGNDTVLLGAQPGGDSADGGQGSDIIRIDYAGVVNPGNGKPVKLQAIFGTGDWQVLVNGVAGVFLTRFERLDFTAGDGNDTIFGGGLDDTLTGGGGHDVVKAGAGHDMVQDSWGKIKANGGAGTDTLILSNTNFKDSSAGLNFDAATGIVAAGTSAHGTVNGFEIFRITGTGRDDTIATGALDDQALGLEGGDLLTMGGGNDTADGGAGADSLTGGAGDDALHGGTPLAGAAQAADQLFGGAGNDHLVVDLPALGALFTFAGAVFDGGGNSDLLEFQTRNAVLDLTGATLTGIEKILFSTSLTFGLRMTAGQAGALAATDVDLNLGTLYITTAGTVVPTGSLRLAAIQLSDLGNAINLGFATILGSAFGPTVIGGAAADNIQGTALPETLSGLGDADILVGRDGSDTLLGGAGRDTILADDGNDRIIGGAGGDDLYGGTTGSTNKDLFTYTAASDSFGTDLNDFDVIDDFLVAGGGGVDFIDRIDVSQIDAKAGGGANDVFGFIGTDPFTAEGQIRATQSGTSTAIEFNISGTGGAEMIIILNNFTAANLTQFDFFL